MNKAVIKDPVFLKESIVESDRFKKHRDLLNGILKDNILYSIKDVEKMIESFQKGKVN